MTDQRKRPLTVDASTGLEFIKNRRTTIADITKDTKISALRYIHAMASRLIRKMVDARNESRPRKRKEGEKDDEMQDVSTEAIERDLSIISGIILSSPYDAMLFYHYLYRIHQYNRQRQIVGYQNFSRIKKMTEAAQVMALSIGEFSWDVNVWQIIFEESIECLGIEAKTVFSDYHQMVCLCNLFYERARELQLGPDHWVQGKVGSNTSKYSSQSFGLMPKYRHYASGLSWDENMRSTLSAYTHGIAHLAIMSVKKMETKYFNKHATAVHRSFSFIQQIKTVTDVVAGNSVHINKKIIEQMCQISALHGDRHVHKTSLGFNVVFNMIGGIGNFNAEGATRIGFSSKTGALCYSLIPQIHGPMNTELFREWYYHCTFGTGSEDFGILSQTTNHKTWKVRSQYKSFLSEMKQTGHTTRANIIKVLIYSKSSSAAQTNLLASGAEPVGCVPVSSGLRRKAFTNELLDNILKSSTDIPLITSSVADVINYLQEIIKSLVVKIKEMKVNNGGNVIYGTTKWHALEGAAFEKGVNGAIHDTELMESGKVFWSSSEQ